MKLFKNKNNREKLLKDYEKGKVLRIEKPNNKNNKNNKGSK